MKYDEKRTIEVAAELANASRVLEFALDHYEQAAWMVVERAARNDPRIKTQMSVAGVRRRNGTYDVDVEIRMILGDLQESCVVSRPGSDDLREESKRLVDWLKRRSA